jgi:hypothetical protein
MRSKLWNLWAEGYAGLAEKGRSLDIAAIAPPLRAKKSRRASIVGIAIESFS